MSLYKLNITNQKIRLPEYRGQGDRYVVIYPAVFVFWETRIRLEVLKQAGTCASSDVLKMHVSIHRSEHHLDKMLKVQFGIRPRQ